MKVKLEGGAFTPTRAHGTDAGLDLYSKEDKIVPAKESAVFDTGVCVELPKNTCGVLVSKSGLNVKHGILSTGLIDEGYQGSIRVKLYNHSGFDYLVKRGDKISQLIIIPVLYEDPEIVDDFDKYTQRGTDGFGSSGR